MIKGQMLLMSELGLTVTERGKLQGLSCLPFDHPFLVMCEHEHAVDNIDYLLSFFPSSTSPLSFF